jgi:Cu2+-containing amine oxidase
VQKKIEEKNKFIDMGKFEKRIFEKIRYIVYDIETVQLYNNNFYFHPVSASFTYIDIENNKYLHKIDENEIIEKCKNTLKFTIKEKINLYEEIYKIMEPKYKNIIIGFNSSKFDNYFLAKSFIIPFKYFY